MAKLDTPKVYLMLECPFCLKFRIFLSEAGLDDKVQFVNFNGGDDTHQATRNKMIEAGQKPSFPAVEFEEGVFTTETDALIAHFAGPAGVDPSKLSLLTYYTDALFPRIISMHKELNELKQKVGK